MNRFANLSKLLLRAEYKCSLRANSVEIEKAHVSRFSSLNEHMNVESGGKKRRWLETDLTP